jgi:hypothetical protein
VEDNASRQKVNLLWTQNIINKQLFDIRFNNSMLYSKDNHHNHINNTHNHNNNTHNHINNNHNHNNNTHNHINNNHHNSSNSLYISTNFNNKIKKLFHANQL